MKRAMEYPVVKIESVFLSPMPAPLLYTGFDTAKMCNAHSMLKKTTRTSPH